MAGPTWNDRQARRGYLWLRGRSGRTASGHILAKHIGMTYGSSHWKAAVRKMKLMAKADGFCWVYPDYDNGYKYGLTVNPDETISNLVHLDQTERGVRAAKKELAQCTMAKHPVGDARLVAHTMLKQIAAIEAYDKKAPVDMKASLEKLRAKYAKP